MTCTILLQKNQSFVFFFKQIRDECARACYMMAEARRKRDRAWKRIGLTRWSNWNELERAKRASFLFCTICFIDEREFGTMYLLFYKLTKPLYDSRKKGGNPFDHVFKSFCCRWSKSLVHPSLSLTSLSPLFSLLNLFFLISRLNWF